MKTVKISVLDILTRLMIFILILFFVTVGARVLTRQVLVKKLGMNNLFTRIVFFDVPALGETNKTAEFDWRKEYPFSDEVAAVTMQSNKRLISEILSNIDSVVRVLENKVGTYTTEQLVLYSRFTEMANLFNKSIGWNLVPPQEYNGVVNMEDGFLTTLVERRNVEENVKTMADLKTFLDAKGIELLYAQIPHKVCREDAGLSGVVDFSNQNTDDFLAGLTKQGIQFLDLREVLHQQGLNHLEMFYRTDHHWKAETGLWAAGVLSGYLNDNYGFTIDLAHTNPLNFDYKVYKDWFLGSQGKKVTLSRAKPEDISLIYPKFPVNLSFRIPSRNVDLAGGFEIIYDYSHIEKMDYYKKNPYAAYIYGDNAISSFRNYLVDESRSILVIGDSNDNSLVPFLALGIQNVDSLDLRHFNGSLRSLIEKSNYDLVIIDYNPTAIRANYLLSHDSFFDFR